jgi:adenylate cyclase
VVEPARRLAAIMFTDMVGYSALAQKDEPAALEALDRQGQLIRPIFTRFRGREVKSMGDGFLVEFDSALEAVRCAIEIQAVLRKAELRARDGSRVQLRIGVHVGDVVESGGDVVGDAVNIASRIQPHAPPGGICITQQAYDQVQNKIEVPFVKLPPVALKNIRLPTTIYRVGESEVAAPTPRRSAPAAEGRHLAVLPLASLSKESEDEYFAEGLTDELISVLSQIRGLSVIARTSVIPYRTSPKSIAQVRDELGVDVVLEGSVRKSGNQIRVSLQLVDAATQSHLWAGSIDRELDDVFQVQSYVAGRAARALRLTLTKSDRTETRSRRVPNPHFGVVTTGEAYDAYLRGLVASANYESRDTEEAFRWFERATTLDPMLADAYAAWANLYVVVAGDSMPMREVMPRAKELAYKALSLDAGSSDAHAALGNIAMQLDNDWSTSEAEFRRALEINPSNVTALRFYGMLLIALGRAAEAQDVFRLLIRLDPAGHHRHSLAWAEIESGSWAAGLARLQVEGGAHADHIGHQIVQAIYRVGAGQMAEARKLAKTLPPAKTDDDRFDLAMLQGLLGQPEPARKILGEFERGRAKSYTSYAHAAMLYAVTGDRERALSSLERDLREGDRVLWLYYTAVVFDSIAADPRFTAMLHQMGLPEGPTLRRSRPAT